MDLHERRDREAADLVAVEVFVIKDFRQFERIEMPVDGEGDIVVIGPGLVAAPDGHRPEAVGTHGLAAAPGIVDLIEAEARLRHGGIGLIDLLSFLDPQMVLFPGLGAIALRRLVDARLLFAEQDGLGPVADGHDGSAHRSGGMFLSLAEIRHRPAQNHLLRPIRPVGQGRVHRKVFVVFSVRPQVGLFRAGGQQDKGRGEDG